MARAKNAEPFASFRFKVALGDSKIADPNAKLIFTSGFNAVTMPTQSVEVAEYQEGTFIYRRKYPGNTTFDDVTMSRGVTNIGNEFHNWVNALVLGQEYSANLIVHHYHRNDLNSTSQATEFSATSVTASRYIELVNAFPVTVKLGSDLDATSSEISIQELTVAYEYYKVSNLIATASTSA